jgi:hypothetical protein
VLAQNKYSYTYRYWYYLERCTVTRNIHRTPGYYANPTTVVQYQYSAYSIQLCHCHLAFRYMYRYIRTTKLYVGQVQVVRVLEYNASVVGTCTGTCPNKCRHTAGARDLVKKRNTRNDSTSTSIVGTGYKCNVRSSPVQVLRTTY